MSAQAGSQQRCELLAALHTAQIAGLPRCVSGSAPARRLRPENRECHPLLLCTSALDHCTSKKLQARLSCDGFVHFL